MRRRKQDPFKQNLISLLRQGRRIDAVALVRDTLAKNPNHAAAQQEWQRLQHNQPFSCEEAQHKKEERYLYQLEAILTRFAQNPGQLAGMKSSSIKKRIKQQRLLVQHIGGVEALPNALSEQYQLYITALSKERARRKKNRHGKSLMGLCLLIGVGLIGICSMAVVHRANVAAETLEQTWEHKEQYPDYAAEVLQTYDTGFNRMLNRRVGHAADRVAHRLKNQYSHIKRVHALLLNVRQGKAKLAELRIEQRVEIQRLCQLRTQQAEALIKLWNELYLREKDDMERLQSAHIADLLTPLPPIPQWSGIPQDDLPLIDQRLAALEEKLKRFKELHTLYNLDKSNVNSFAQELKKLQHTKAELMKLNTCLHALSAVHSYENYLKLLQKRPVLTHYPAAPALNIPTTSLPEEEEFLRDMQQHAAPGIPQKLIAAAIRTLIYGGSSVSADYPASREQLQTMENVFALTGAPIVLYQLINKNGEVCYTEEKPTVKENEVIFKRSVYDPLRDTGDIRAIVWRNPREVWIKPIDIRPVWKACGFHAPQKFFQEAQFPAVLSAILNTEAPYCPELARAYLYHKICELMRQHAHPTMVGMDFAPTMQQHMNDFEQLRQKLHINLHGMCWLQQSPKLAAAEQAFGRWFRAHKGFIYEKEIENLAAQKLLQKANYCGYVNEYGKPVYLSPPKQGTDIRYAENKQICRYPAGQEPPRLPPLSPLFNAKRVYKQQYIP